MVSDVTEVTLNSINSDASLKPCRGRHTRRNVKPKTSKRYISRSTGLKFTRKTALESGNQAGTNSRRPGINSRLTQKSWMYACDPTVQCTSVQPKWHPHFHLFLVFSGRIFSNFERRPYNGANGAWFHRAKKRFLDSRRPCLSSSE